MNIVESLLVCVYSAKYINVAAAYDCRMSISRLRRRSIRSVNLVPIVGQETILEDIVHCVMTVPSAKDEHAILVHDC